MKMSDSREIAATPDVVYAAFLNPDVLKSAVPGASAVDGNPTDGYTATVTQKVGPVKATFKGAVTMSDMVENQTLTISGEGKGGAAGFAKGGAIVTLTATETGTLVAYDVDAKVGGKLAQLGSRLIDGFAKKMADQFFLNLKETIEGPPQDVEAIADGPEADSAPEAANEETTKKGWLGKLTGRG
jgi:carbon monoxide dehydrogenase subunit G